MRKSRKTVKIFIILMLVAGVLFVAYHYVSMAIADYMLKNMVKNELQSLFDSGKLKIEDFDTPLSEKNTDKNGVKQTGGKTSVQDDQSQAAPTTNSGDAGIAGTESEETVKTGQTGTKSAAPTKDASVQQAIEQKANEITSQVSASDKQDIANMVLSKLSSEDISYLSGLLGDGLTKDEKKIAKGVAYSRFNADEIKRIKEYYKKYVGMVQ